eukprot:CAMPEP_0118685046 /NCGR_PEP_ID=MMETSP0800-20121206/7007_1 /TAXON_ID=210618 ORGANISM="Striatella unipunctata, Strain CCMP2910" /NCGR_SAMPLE_ID=MMETSP0800 /ASSEMBLY_ACC=CAM_ASM_000638 /LENGTH=105 /DNA_ID=CAMNT_0006581871 /DNA_START=47 /DNA_END=364 /DNA_ORIENTATION=-
MPNRTEVTDNESKSQEREVGRIRGTDGRNSEQEETTISSESSNGSDTMTANEQATATTISMVSMTDRLPSNYSRWDQDRGEEKSEFMIRILQAALDLAQNGDDAP